MTKLIEKITAGVGVVGVAGLVLATSAGTVNAASVTSPFNQKVVVSAASIITLDATLTGDATLAPDPATTGFDTEANTLTLSSNDSSGAKLTLHMISTDTNAGALVASDVPVSGAGTKIDAGSGTLTANQWGYTLGSTVPTAASTFSQVPIGAASPVQIITVTPGAGSGSETVNYGALIDYTLVPSVNGYVNDVTYTASVGN